jgi:phosphatidate phosphatase APP1
MKIHSEHKEKKISLIKRIKRKIFFFLRLNDHPVIKVYHGYGNQEKIVVIGHVLKLSPFPRKSFRTNWFVNLFSMLRLFIVVPYSNAKISIEWQEEIYHTRAREDGFFRCEFFPKLPPQNGWQKVLVRLEEDRYRLRVIQSYGEVYIPFPSQHAFISDIDDTFLISHSGRLRRKLFVLLTKNARNRQPFEGVVHHYEMLSSNNRVDENCNPFFYVSGSEWNLYNLLVEFSHVNHLPKGIFLLSTMKTFWQLWKTGANNLMSKFLRIIRVIEAFPHLQFVLLGDDSQIDVQIYLSVVKHFPGKIFAVYIRQVGKTKKPETHSVVKEIESHSIHCCYFEHSRDAILHSERIGLIKKNIMEEGME